MAWAGPGPPRCVGPPRVRGWLSHAVPSTTLRGWGGIPRPNRPAFRADPRPRVASEDDFPFLKVFPAVPTMKAKCLSGLFPFWLIGCLLAAPAAAAEEASSEPSKQQAAWVTSIAPLGDSGRFVASTADGLLLREASVVSFSGADPTSHETLYTHPAAVWCVASTADGKTVVSVDYRGNLAVYDTDAEKAELHDQAFERWCQAMILSYDDGAVIAGNEAGKVMAWDLDKGEVTGSLDLGDHAVTALALSPDRSRLAVTDGGGRVHLVKWPELESTGQIKVSDQAAWCVAFVDQGESLLVGSADRHLYRCEAKPKAEAESVMEGGDWITQLAVSPSGEVAAAQLDGELYFPKPSGGSGEAISAASGVWALHWNSDSQLMVGTRKTGVAVAGRAWTWAAGGESEADEG